MKDSDRKIRGDKKSEGRREVEKQRQMKGVESYGERKTE